MSLFLSLPGSSGDGSLPELDYADIDYLGPDTYERGAAAHWRLKGSAASLADLKSGQMLTLQSVAPAYNATHAVVTTDDGKALLTPFDDSAIQTLCLVVMLETQAFSVNILGGTISGSGSESPLKGGAIFTNANDPAIVSNIRGGTQTSLTSIATNGQWQFVALSENQPAKTSTLFVGGPSSTHSTVAMNAKTIANRKVAIGNGYFSVTSGFTRKFASAIYFNRALNVAGLQKVYEREKARLAADTNPVIVV